MSGFSGMNFTPIRIYELGVPRSMKLFAYLESMRDGTKVVEDLHFLLLLNSTYLYEGSEIYYGIFFITYKKIIINQFV